jgi:hypothetical protein
LNGASQVKAKLCATADKSESIGMVTTGVPASYVELLSCVENLSATTDAAYLDAAIAESSGLATALLHWRSRTARRCGNDRYHRPTISGQLLGRFNASCLPQ